MKPHTTHTRKILCRRGLSTKRPQRIHANRAGKRAFRTGSTASGGRISCPEEDGFVAAMQGESFFIHDVMPRRKYRASGSKRIRVQYARSHRKVTVYESLARDGRQFLRTYDRFDTSSFTLYLKEVQKHSRGVAANTDRALPRRSKDLRKFRRQNRNVRILYSPRDSPNLNAAEKCRNRGRHMPLVSEYYKTFSDMRRAVSMHCRTARFNPELPKYASRKVKLARTNL